MDSGVTIGLRVPAAVRRIRRAYDPSAARGVPPHVTLLYPFLAADLLDAGVRVRLAAIAGAHDPFEVDLTEIGRWPTVVHLRAEPAEAFVRLTEAIADRWPECPPYGGVHDVLVPHLTLAETDDGSALEAAARAAARLRLPIRTRAERVEVMVEGPDGRWRPRWRLRLGR